LQCVGDSIQMSEQFANLSLVQTPSAAMFFLKMLGPACRQKIPAQCCGEMQRREQSERSKRSKSERMAAVPTEAVQNKRGLKGDQLESRDQMKM